MSNLDLTFDDHVHSFQTFYYVQTIEMKIFCLNVHSIKIFLLPLLPPPLHFLHHRCLLHFRLLYLPHYC